MSIRFTCLACKTVLKIADRISEQKKVRCTGCGVVIVLTPDEEGPDGMTTSIPDQAPKPKKGANQEINPWVLLGVAAAVVLVVALGLWWYFSPPNDRGAIVGEVTLDTFPLQNGMIRFVPIDNPKATVVHVPILQGRFEAGAATGPFVGKNKWLIIANENEKIAERYKDVKLAESIDITTGLNTHNFDVKSK